MTRYTSGVIPLIIGCIALIFSGGILLISGISVLAGAPIAAGVLLTFGAILIYIGGLGLWTRFG